MHVQKDQKKFFDQYATGHIKKEPVNSFFFELAVAEVREGFRWLSDRNSILDYGCGTGETIDLYLSTTKSQPARIVGIDLSEVSIDVARDRYPYEFHVVPDNDLSFAFPSSLTGAYMIGVLHHSEHHQKIFDEISRVLERGGKFFIVDLTRNNPLIEFARFLFPYMPKRVKQMFPDDLVIDGTIPEKLRVEIDVTLLALERAGFVVEDIKYGHLFFFVFDWLERITGLPVSRTKFKVIYSWLYKLEKTMLGMNFFKHRAHLFAIRAVKKG